MTEVVCQLFNCDTPHQEGRSVKVPKRVHPAISLDVGQPALANGLQYRQLKSDPVSTPHVSLTISNRTDTASPVVLAHGRVIVTGGCASI